MNLIQRLMRRRQFLMAAGVGSACALTYKKFAGIANQGLQTQVAKASEGSVAAVMNEVSDKYSHILSPLKIGNVVLKNRLYMPNSTPHFLQGPENFPSDAIRTYYMNLAKNGAAIVTVETIQNKAQREVESDIGHMQIYDLKDHGVQNYLDQLVEGIHLHGSKASTTVMVGMMGMMPGAPGGGARGQGAPGEGAGVPGAPASQPGNASEDVEETIESTITQAKFYQSHGFDALQLSIRGNEELNIKVCEAAKKALPDMLIITEIFVREPSITQHMNDSYYQSGTSLDDAVKYAKKLEGKADIIHVRISDSMASHATTWNSLKNKPYAIHYAEAIKKSGAKIITAPSGGFQNLDLNEEYIASGKTDMITMARAFICDWEYGKKMAAGRGEDVVPCIRCNKCHGVSMEGPWYVVCSVNPMIGIPAAVRGIGAPGLPKKVAVIGGGPAGMKAAITAAERGHKVTLYEKSSELGGLAKHSNYSPYKWAMKDFKDYLVKNVNKAGIEVILNTAADFDMIKAKGYDTILVAVGSEPVIPRIPGADGSNVYSIVDAYPKEKSMGKNVVVIGGGEFGADVGIHLCKAGHNVTMLTSEKELFPINRPHYPESIVRAYEDLKNFDIITEGTATRISADKVTYRDAAGKEKSIQTDDVVVYAGFKPKKDEALAFYGSSKQYFTIGDCSEIGGSIQKSIRSAFFAASQV